MRRDHISKMQKRIESALETPAVVNRIMEDWTYTFTQLGLDDPAARVLVFTILPWLNAGNLLKAEKLIHKAFKKDKIGNKTIWETLTHKLAGRAQTIYKQISPHIPKDAVQIMDYGCGDGQVAQLLHNGLRKSVYGYDVRDYRAPGVTVPIIMIEGKGVCAVDGYFSVGVVTNVLHHAENNQTIITDLTRLIDKGRQLIVIETVPVKDEAIEFEVTFMNDYLYNRLFHDADVPVPGTYETTLNWINRFAKAGWKIEHAQDLGYDQPTIRDWHILLVFTKL